MNNTPWIWVMVTHIIPPSLLLGVPQIRVLCNKDNLSISQISSKNATWTSTISQKPFPGLLQQMEVVVVNVQILTDPDPFRADHFGYRFFMDHLKGRRCLRTLASCGWISSSNFKRFVYWWLVSLWKKKSVCDMCLMDRLWIHVASIFLQFSQN